MPRAAAAAATTASPSWRPPRPLRGWSSSGPGGFLLLLAFLEIVCTRVGISQGHNNQAFIQTDGELRYLVDGVPTPVITDGLASEDQVTGYEDGDGTVTVLGSPIRFEPSELDFGDQPLGIPILRKVHARNLNSENSIQMLSISGNTIHFHCSFFADKVISPSGNTTFDVVFLGRDEGFVENTLYIHTSAGSFRFVVRARGTPNPYRLRPLIGVRMPVNSSYSPMIELHNPHPEPIQVLEMYSSGGDLHLELPGGETEGPQTLWQIPPYQTKSVMKANFVARMENNHTAYIRIKTNTTGAEFLYLPLEVEVSSQPGLYCPQEVIDFGLVPAASSAASQGPPNPERLRTAKLLLLNSGQRSVVVANVIATPVTEALSIKFTPTKVPADTMRPTVVAEITFDPSLVSEEGLHTGKIVVKSKNSQYKVTLPYRAHVLRGGLTIAGGGDVDAAAGGGSPAAAAAAAAAPPLDESLAAAVAESRNAALFHLRLPGEEEVEDQSIDPDTAAHGGQLPMMVRNLTATNDFVGVGVAVHGVKLAPAAAVFFDARLLFSNSSGVILLPAGATRPVVELRLKPAAALAAGRLLDSHLTLYTNVSSVRVSLKCFHGRLNTFFPSSPGQKILDYGTLGMGEKRDLYFTVINRNPVSVTLRGWGANLTGSLVELMGVAEGNETQILQRTNFSGMTRRLVIYPGHYMVFRIGVLTREEDGAEGETAANVFVDTDHHTFRVGFRLTVARGTLFTVPRDLVFDPAFPGKSVDLKLRVFSSFTQGMTTTSVETVPPDPRFSFRESSKTRGRIFSGQKNLVGRIIFDPEAACRREQNCYSGFDAEDTKIGKEWLSGLGLSSSLADSDIALTHMLHKRLLETVHPSSAFNVTLRLDTSQVRGFLLTARASLVWPLVLSNYKSSFELTQVGNATFTDVTLRNPSDRDLWVHLVPLAAYPNGAKVANMLPSRSADSSSPRSNFTSFWPNDVLRVVSVTLEDGDNTKLKSFVSSSEDTLGAQTKAFVVPPGRSARARLRFKPVDAGLLKQAIFVRNNLTGLEMVEVFGEAAHGSLSLGGHDGDAGGVLRFEVQEKHLKDCAPDARKSRYSPPLLSVRRSFRLKNTGRTPLNVIGFSVEGMGCQGFGFRVLDCIENGAESTQFSLAAGEERLVDVAFTPDFTLTVVRRSLALETTLALPGSNRRKLNFTLEATLPSVAAAAQCAAALPRPPWETYLYYGANTLMLLLAACVVAAAFCESDRVVKGFMGGGGVTAAAAAAIIQQQQQQAGLDAATAEPFDLRGIHQQVSQELRHRATAAAAAAAAAAANGVGGGGSGRAKSRDRPPSSNCLHSTDVFDNNTHHHPIFSRSRPPMPPLGLGGLFGTVASSLLKAVLWPVRLVKSGVFLATSDKSPPPPPSPVQQQQSPPPLPPPSSWTSSRDQLRSEVAAKLSPKASSQRQQQADPKAKGLPSTLATSSAGRKTKKKQQNPPKKKQLPLPPAAAEDDAETSSTTTESSNLEEENRNKSNDLNASEGQQKKAAKKATKANNQKSLAANSKASKTMLPASPSLPDDLELLSKKSVSGKQQPKSNAKVEKAQPKEGSTSNKKQNRAGSVVEKVKEQQQQPRKGSDKQHQSKANNKQNVRNPSPVESNKSSRSHQQQSRNSNDEVKKISNPERTAAAGGCYPERQQQQQQQRQKAKVTPVGKILPEPKKPENLGAQFGPVGTRPLPPRPSTWSNSPAEATPTQGNSMFGQLPPAPSPPDPVNPEKQPEKIMMQNEFGQQQPQQQALHRSHSSPFHHQRGESASGDLSPAFGGPSGANTSAESPNRSQNTLMQSLQLERRLRMEEYLRQRTDWPGFNDSSQQRSFLEDLWDPTPVIPMGSSSTRPPLGTATPSAEWAGGNSWTDWSGVSLGEDTISVHQQNQHQQQMLQSGQGGVESPGGLGLAPLQQLSSIWDSPRKRRLLAEQQQQQQQGSWSSSLFKD